MSQESLQTLSELRTVILSTSVNLLKLIDTYTSLKSRESNKDQNTLSAFRNDAVTLAYAAAAECTNPDDDSFSEKNAKEAQQVLDILGVN